MEAGLMSRRRCSPCCYGDCVLFSDDFNRANNVDLESSWYEPPGHDALEIEAYCPGGTPTIAHGAVVAPFGSGGGGAIWQKPHPKRSATMQARIYTLDDHLLIGSGLAVELLLGVEFDPVTKQLGAMHVATFTLSDPPVITLSTRVGMDGATTGIAEDTVEGLTIGSPDPDRAGPCGERYRRMFIATLNGNAFCASISNAFLSLVSGNPDFSLYGSSLDRWYSGFAVSALEPPDDEEELYVDEWELLETYDTNPNCGYCGCGCGSETLPPELTVTVHAEGCMAAVDGETATLTWDRAIQNWTGTMVTDCTTWDLTLTCPSMEPPFEATEFTLCITGECFDSDPCGVPPLNCRLSSADSTCDPLLLEFGCNDVEGDCDHDPFRVAWSDLACPCCEPDPMEEGYHGSFCFSVTA